MRFVFSAMLLAVLGYSPLASAFCGFYVTQADSELFNEASQVVLVRDGDRTVLTMANDFKGEAEDFAIVIPRCRPLETYKWKARVVFKPFVNSDDAWQEYKKWISSRGDVR